MMRRGDSGQMRAALGAEATIGLTGLYQARAGGNRAMIANAERYLVTNPEVSLRKRAARELQAPWNKDDTVRFLKSGAAIGRSSSNNSTEEELRSASTYSSTHGSVGRDLLEEDAPMPGWRKVIEQGRSAKAARLRGERESDHAMVQRTEWEMLGRDLERASIINHMRENLNVDLLKVAERADRSFQSTLDSAVSNRNNKNTEEEESARRAETLENIANGLSSTF